MTGSHHEISNTSSLKQAGFSLVELMVVVAIIGALAMVAVPRVNRFIAKARTSEAQVNLSSIYTFNKNFFVEFQGYTNDFTAMGYTPEGNLRYNIGWSQAGVVPAQYLAVKPFAAGNTNTLARCPTLAAVPANPPPCVTLQGSTNAAPPAIPASAIAADFSTFTAQAIAVIAATSACANNADLWAITENKNLANLCDGTQ